MRLPKIVIQNFRNITNATLDFGSATFIGIRGGNYQGKSSIKQAISMLLTPTTEGLNAKGDGYVTKIKRGETKAVIVGDIQGKSKLVQRTVTLNTNTSGRTDSSKCLDDPEWHPAPFEKLLDANKAALSIALNTDKFTLLDEKDQKGLLAKLALPSSYDFPEDKVAAVEKAIGAGEIDFTGEPFAVIDAAYKKLYAERQLVNRQVKEFVIPDSLVAGNHTSASLQENLSAAREARQRILTEKDAAVKKAGDSDNERTRIKTKLDNIQTQIAEEKEKLAKIDSALLPEAKHKELVKVAAGKEESDRLIKERNVVLATVTTLKAELDRIGQLLEKFADAGAKCPTCEQEVDMRVLESLAAGVQQELTEAQGRDTALNGSLKALGHVDAALADIAQHNAKKEEWKVVSAVIAEKEKTHKIGTEKLAAMGERVDVVSQFEEPLITADNEITAITEQLRPVIAAEERTKEIEAKKAELEKKKAKAANIDALVKYFDKDGIKAELLKQYIGGFEEKLNSVMSIWGYKCSLSIEPYEFLCTDTKGVTTPVSELSGSEQLMFSIALQCAVSRASGVGIVIADRVDTFLPAQRSKANQCLYTATQDGTLDQAIVISSDDSEQVPTYPGAVFFKVEDGMVRKLGEA